MSMSRSGGVQDIDGGQMNTDLAKTLNYHTHIYIFTLMERPISKCPQFVPGETRSCALVVVRGCSVRAKHKIT